MCEIILRLNKLLIFQSSDMLQCMASCHSVTIIEEKLSGDPMDVIMFVSTGWNLEEQSAESTNQVRFLMSCYLMSETDQLE